jgi:glycosyltransferase involved in cell wall biosynthesis
MKTDVSIVLPTYNGQRFLRQAVESCIEQTYRDWELILVDDCSNDATPELIEELTRLDGRIKSTRHSDNRKLPAALNTGFARSSGRLLTWTSDDNIYRPHALERMVEFLEQRPEVDFVYTDMTIINDAGQRLRLRPAEPLNRLALKNPIGACFLYRRTVYETVGQYNEQFFLTEDYDYWLRISGRFSMVPLAEDLYLYRDHERSLTNAYVERIERLVAECFEQNIANIRWCGKRLLAERCLRFSQEAIRRGEVELSRKWLGRAREVSLSSMLLSAARVGKLMIRQALHGKTA